VEIVALSIPVTAAISRCDAPGRSLSAWNTRATFIWRIHAVLTRFFLDNEIPRSGLTRTDGRTIVPID
jgi:hypothetical protein